MCPVAFQGRARNCLSLPWAGSATACFMGHLVGNLTHTRYQARSSVEMATPWGLHVHCRLGLSAVGRGH